MQGHTIRNLCSLFTHPRPHHTHTQTSTCIYPCEQWNGKRTWSMKIKLLLRWPQSSSKRILFPRPEKKGCKSKEEQSSRKVSSPQSIKICSFHLYYTTKGRFQCITSIPCGRLKISNSEEVQEKSTLGYPYTVYSSFKRLQLQGKKK